MRVPDSSLVLPETWEDSHFQFSLPIENDGDKEVAVDDFMFSCDCLSVEPRSLVLPAGGRETLRVTLDLTHRSPTDLDKPIRDYAVAITPHLRDAPSSLIRWVVRGKVRSALSVTPRVVDFGDRLIRGRPFPSERVRVTAHVPVKGIEVRCDSSKAQVEVSPVEGAGQFDVRIVPSAALAAKSFSVSIHAILVDGRRVPDILLPVRAQVGAEIRAFPSVLRLGAKRVGEMVTESVVLEHHGGRAFEVAGIEHGPDVLSVEPWPASRTGFRCFRVTHKIGSMGAHSSVVTFRTRGQGMDPLNVVLPVEYYGVTAAAVSAPVAP